jgi:excisionase family DNA binding protein
MFKSKLLLTYREAGEALSLSTGMIQKLVRTGRIEVVRIGRSVRISQAEVLRLSGVPTTNQGQAST